MSDQLPFGDARREAIERKLLAFGFTSYQQFAEACAALLLQEHPTFVHAVRAACHLESDAAPCGRRTTLGVLALMVAADGAHGLCTHATGARSPPPPPATLPWRSARNSLLSSKGGP